MKIRSTFLLFLVLATHGHAVSVEELNKRFKKLPTVAEKDLPELSNQREPFPGVIQHEGLQGHVWTKFPFVENPGSIGIDRKGRIFVTEVNRFWLGVPDLRGANELIREDFQATEVADRAKLYEKYKARFPEGFFTTVADRIIRLEDKDGNGAADHRTLFSDHFKHAVDGIGFSVLPEDDAVYFTCIPKVWKLIDQNDDGVADVHDSIAEGFGVRVSFIGHDLHGIIRGPDGRLYFSVGDRGYNVTTKEGKNYSAPGRGAIFRCESDGSDFEVVCTGLRNPQELAFDEYGNLFTFDKTGDIGDLARLVYVLEGSDSGWDMSHQSAHHYRKILDWENFHPQTSMWVKEQMFKPWNKEQPQWVYPPASNVARGPSGVTYLSGDSLPVDLQGKFLLANYRGPSVNCTGLLIGVKPEGAGYVAASEEVLFKGVGVTDVEHGFDGKIYICDFGGGWSVNTQGAIQVLEPIDPRQKAAGEEIKAWFQKGLQNETLAQLALLLNSSDKRLRKFAQFELVNRGQLGLSTLQKIAQDSSWNLTARLHAIWGLGQLARKGEETGGILGQLTSDHHPEIRANTARTLGDSTIIESKDRLIQLLEDKNLRVRSLAALALSRVAERGDEQVTQALFGMAKTTGELPSVDPVLRHACLTALDRVGTPEAVLKNAKSESEEVRLISLLYFRRHESEKLNAFLDDPSPLLRTEAIRAIYDTQALHSMAGESIAKIPPEALQQYPSSVQRRVVAANYRLAMPKHARNLLAIASSEKADLSVRKAALHALHLWDKRISTDPVLGHYRPQQTPAEENVNTGELGREIEDSFSEFLQNNPPLDLQVLAIPLADKIGIRLHPGILRDQVGNMQLPVDLRVVALDSLVNNNGAEALPLVKSLIVKRTKEPALLAAAIRHGFALNIPNVETVALEIIESGSVAAARTSIAGLGKKNPQSIAEIWNQHVADNLRPELRLDLYMVLKNSTIEANQQIATTFAQSGKHAVHLLSKVGGDPVKGESIFRNQGACMQCHKIRSGGGIQGPALTRVADRLSPAKLVESLVDPGAEISPGYGNSILTLKDGTTLTGRIPKKTKGQVTIVALGGKETVVPAAKIKSTTPPISAMPPLGATLPPLDLRDLVAYLSTLKFK